MAMRLLAVVALVAFAPALAHGSRVDKTRSSHRRPVRALPPVELDHLSTHESFVLRPDPQGRLPARELRGLRRFLRCHHTGRQHAISPRLPELLYATAHHFGDRPITVIAGYRAPRVAREKGNPRSPHRRGLACDFRIDGIRSADLRDYVRHAFHRVGVGYYPNSGFVHLDVGRSRDAFWIDYSGPGERARYSSDPDGDLQAGLDEERDDGEVALPRLEDAERAAGDAAASSAASGVRPEDSGFARSAPARTPLE